MTSFEVKISPGGARGMSEENEKIPMLLLAPFQKPPTITFQDVQLGSKVERHLIISNRGSHNQVQVKFSKLPSSEHNFVFSDTELSLDPNETTAVIIRWAPSKLGSWREAVRVNYSSNARMDLPVYILFNSIPPIKKRKRNVGIKPLRHQNSVDPVYQVPKKNAKFIMSPKSRMSSSNRHDRKTTPNKENNAPRSGNRKGKKSTPVFGSPLIKPVGQTPTSILGLGQSKDSPSPSARSRRSRSSGGHPSSSASRLKSRRSRSSSHTDFFDYISALTLSPVTLRLNGIPTPDASRGQPSDSTPLRRETFLTSRTQSVPGDDNEEDDGFLSLNGRLLPPCSVAPSPLRRTTYDVGGFGDLGEEFVPASRDPLPPCTVPPSPWRRTTYLASENVRPGSEEETFVSLTGARLPPCEVDPSPLRRTTYTAYDVRPSPSEMSWGEIPSTLRPNAMEAKRARDNPFGLGESSRVLKEKTHNFSNVVSGPTPRRSRKTTYTTASESTYENFENIIEGIAYSVTRSTCTYTEKKKKNYSSSESDKFSGDSLDDAPTRGEESSAVNVPVPVCKALRFDDEEDVASDGLPVDEDHERKMRRCSNETYVKSPCSSSVADYRTPSAAVVSPDGNESVQSVIQAGLWCEPFLRNVSQSSDIASSSYSTRSKTRASSSAKKTISRTGPPAARRALSTSTDSKLMRPPVGRPPKGGGRATSLRTISVARAQSATKTLSERLVTSTPVSAPLDRSRRDLHRDPDDFLYELANPDPFCPSTTTDPFVMSQVYHSNEWLDRQVVNFVKWLNDLLTPSDDLDSNAEPPKVDLATLWQKSCRKAAPTLAPSVEVVSSRALTHGRLEAVRKAASHLYRSAPVAQVLTKVVGHVDRGLIAVRPDRQIHLDVGLRSAVMGLLLCYNPLWLRIGLETVYAVRLELRSNSDVEGLGAFVATRLLDDPYTARKFAHPSVPGMRLPGYEDAIKKFVLKKFLTLVYFLDLAKGRRLIGHDPCLFCKNAEYKESNAILLSFARELVSGKLITKQLGTLGYAVTHKQTYLNEFDFAVTHLGSDLRDGIRLTRVMEIILRDNSLQAGLRVPAISLLQKVHNVGVALKALERAGYALEGDITARDVTNGHREKTLSLLWQIVHKFQAPRFRSAALAVQSWWRSLRVVVSRRIANRELRRRAAAATTIQALWRGRLARRRYLVVKENARETAAKRNRAAVIIQTVFRGYVVRKRIEDSAANRNVTFIRAATTIQAAFRGYLQRRRLRHEDESARRIQRRYRRYRAKQQQQQLQAKIDWENKCATRIQAAYRGYRVRRQRARLNNAAVALQAVARGFLCRKRLERRMEAAKRIQTWFRRQQARQRLALLVIAVEDEITNIRRERLTLQAAIVIQKYARGHLVRGYVSRLRAEAKEAERRIAATKIQALFRGYLERQHLRSKHVAAARIQAAFRGHLERQRLRSKHAAATRIQAAFRGHLERQRLRSKHVAAARIQAAFRGHLERQRLRSKHAAATRIQAAFRGHLERQRLQSKHAAAARIQAAFRGHLERQRLRSKHAAAARIQAAFRGHLERQRLRSKHAAATRIQAAFRGHLERQRLRSKHAAATRIQAAFRSHLERQRLRSKHAAATRIQAAFRGHLEKQRLRSKHAAAARIQAAFRGHLERQRLRSKHAAAARIQAAFRGHLERQRLRSKHAAATRIQAAFRGHLERQRLRSKHAAATRIQAAFRGHLERQRLRSKHAAATRIQAAFRGHLEKQRLRSKHAAAARIQAAFRGHLERQRLRSKHAAAARIQAAFRGHLERQRLRSKHAAATRIQAAFRSHLERQRLRSKHAAATRIQAAFRGHLERQRLRSKHVAATRIQAAFRGRLERQRLRSKHAAATRIQAAFRGHLERQRLRSKHAAATRIQAAFRGHLERQRLRSKHAAATRIQAAFRGHLERQRLRSKHAAAARIQAAFRGHLERQRLRSKHAAAARIQAAFRGHLERQRLRSKHAAATRIQAAFRGHLERQRLRSKHAAAARIQAAFRGHLERQSLRSKHAAATRIQAAFRGHLERQRLQSKHAAAARIQAAFRGHLEGQRLRSKHVAATRIQAAFRGLLERQRLRSKHAAATRIQAAFRGLLERQRLRSKHAAATRIQAAFRGHLERQRLRSKHAAATRIQAAFRGHLERQRLRSKHAAATRIQAAFRGHLERQRLRSKHAAATRIQAAFRGYLERQRLRLERESARRIQRCYRRYRTKQQQANIDWENKCATRIQAAYRGYRVRQEQARLRRQRPVPVVRLTCLEATITLQKYVRGFLARRHVSCLRRQRDAVEAERKVSATKIQAWWRGFQSRKMSHCKEVVAIRERLIEVNQNVIKGTTLLCRYLETSKMLSTTVSMGHLLMALTTLDTVTRLSPTLCEKFCEDGLIDVLYGYLDELNRSVPHMDCIALITQIFLNLVRHPPTVHPVYQDCECLPVLLRLMKTFGGKPSPIFNNCCTLVWLFALECDKAKALTADADTKKQLLKLHSDEERRWQMAVQTGKRRDTRKNVLPAVEPHWALNRERRPRAFEDQYHAICTLLKILFNVQTKKT